MREKEYKEVLCTDGALLFITEPQTIILEILRLIDPFSKRTNCERHWDKFELFSISKVFSRGIAFSAES